MIDDHFLINHLKLKGTTPEGIFEPLWFWLSQSEHETFTFSLQSLMIVSVHCLVQVTYLRLCTCKVVDVWSQNLTTAKCCFFFVFFWVISHECRILKTNTMLSTSTISCCLGHCRSTSHAIFVLSIDSNCIFGISFKIPQNPGLLLGVILQFSLITACIFVKDYISGNWPVKGLRCQ